MRSSSGIRALRVWQALLLAALFLVWHVGTSPTLLPPLYFDDPNRATHYINSSTTVRSRQNRVGATYSFNYDLRQDMFLQQRYLAYYNAQCCGFGVEYQSFNFTNGFAGVPIPQDRRLNISVTLAGIGSFSNLLGAFGGQGR